MTWQLRKTGGIENMAAGLIDKDSAVVRKESCSSWKWASRTYMCCFFSKKRGKGYNI